MTEAELRALVRDVVAQHLPGVRTSDRRVPAIPASIRATHCSGWLLRCSEESPASSSRTSAAACADTASRTDTSAAGTGPRDQSLGSQSTGCRDPRITVRECHTPGVTVAGAGMPRYGSSPPRCSSGAQALWSASSNSGTLRPCHSEPCPPALRYCRRRDPAKALMPAASLRALV